MGNEELIKENEELRKEFDILSKKYSRVLTLSQQQAKLSERTKEEFDKLLKTVEELENQITDQNELVTENNRLKRENERLKGSIELLQQKYKDIEREQPSKFRKEKTDLVSARILSLYIVEDNINVVLEKMKSKYGVDVAKSKAYRTISVTEPDDYQRVMILYRNYSEEFGHMTEESINKWFQIKRIKKLNLKNEFALVDEYGAKLVSEVLQRVKEDEYAKGYYAVEEFERLKNKKVISNIDELIEEEDTFGI